MAKDDSVVEKNLKRFDELDFEAWNKRNWKLFNEIHSPDDADRQAATRSRDIVS